MIKSVEANIEHTYHNTETLVLNLDNTIKYSARVSMHCIITVAEYYHFPAYLLFTHLVCLCSFNPSEQL